MFYNLLETYEDTFFLMRYITETCQGKNVILIYLILGCSWMKLEVYLIKININLEKI